MSDPPQEKQSRKSRFLRPIKGLFSKLNSRSASPSNEGAQSVTPDNAGASRSTLLTNSATTALQVNPPSHQLITHGIISSSSTDNAISAPQINQDTEYAAILSLPTTPSDRLTWENRMKEWGSTTYEGLKIAIQGIYDCSSIFPPLQATAGVLLTISKAVDVCGSLCSMCRYTNNFSYYASESFCE